MTEPTGEPLGIEREIFTRYGLSARDFRSPELGRVRGARRPLRVKPEAVELAAGVDQFGAHITVAFTLPAGSFATVLVGELTKSDATTSD
jgi:tRNA(Glu) U13 pseudouridine synthase TruD